MTAVKAIPTMMLFNLSKDKTYDHEGKKQVHISKRTKMHSEMEQVYLKLCSEFKNGELFTWSELYDLLGNELERRKFNLKAPISQKNNGYSVDKTF